SMSLKMRGDNVNGSGDSVNGMVFQASGASSLCLDMANEHSVGSGSGYLLLQSDTGEMVLPGYAGVTAPGVAAYLSAPGRDNVGVVAASGTFFDGGCAQPPTF